jgi:hypothetical protein
VSAAVGQTSQFLAPWLLRHGGLARAYLCERVVQKARGDACYTGAVELETRNVRRREQAGQCGRRRS